MNAPSFLLALLWVSILTTHAQPVSESQKIGHADVEYIFSQMPQFKQIESELNTFETQLQNQLKTKRTELETKYKAYQILSPTTPDAIRKDKETELNYLQQNLQKFNEEAVASMQKKQNDLVTPVINTINATIKTVALENGYTYILPQQPGNNTLLYTDEKYNISALVLAKMKITGTPAQTNSASTP